MAPKNPRARRNLASTLWVVEESRANLSLQLSIFSRTDPAGPLRIFQLFTGCDLKFLHPAAIDGFADVEIPF
jgi:hypothetical protein